MEAPKGSEWARVKAQTLKPEPRSPETLLGGSRVVISGVIISPLVWVISIVTLLTTPFKKYP